MVEITFEDIYEILRAEKYSVDLQQIKQEELKKIREYLKAKHALLEKESAILDKSKLSKIKAELENAERALKDLHEKREKKILNRAIYTSRSKIKDTTNMLPSEEKIYEKLVEMLESGCSEFFENFNHLKEEICEAKTPEIEEKKEEFELMRLSEANAAQGEGNKAFKGENLGSPSFRAKDFKNLQKLVLVRLSEAVPELMDSEMNRFGPFEANSEASLPEELANLLLQQGKAVEIKENTK